MFPNLDYKWFRKYKVNSLDGMEPSWRGRLLPFNKEYVVTAEWQCNIQVPLNAFLNMESNIVKNNGDTLDIVSTGLCSSKFELAFIRNIVSTEKHEEYNNVSPTL